MARDTSYARIHLAAKEAGLEGDDLRDVYERVTGKRSLRAMSQKEREAIIADFASRGFNVRAKIKGKSSKGFVRLIYALWASCAKLKVIDDGSKGALRKFVANQTTKQGKRVDDPEFLNYDDANPIIETLKSMEERGKAAS